MASIDKRPDGRYRARWREYPGGPQQDAALRPQGRRRAVPRWHPRRSRPRAVHRPRGRPGAVPGVRGAVAGRPDAPASTRRAGRDLPPPATPTRRSGRRPIGAIRRSEIQAWVKDRSDGPRARLGRARLPMGGDGVQGRRRRPPHRRPRRAIASKLPKQDRARDRAPLEVEAVERLVGALPDRYRALIVFAAGTGLRQGECFGLTVDRVDFLRRQVRVDRQLLGARPASQNSDHRRATPASGPCRCPARRPRHWPHT